jgi:hypothetical protein
MGMVMLMITTIAIGKGVNVLTSDPEFGKEVRALLDRLGLTAHGAYVKSGLVATPQTITYWMLGRMPRDLDKFFTFVRALDPESERTFRSLMERKVGPYYLAVA